MWRKCFRYWKATILIVFIWLLIKFFSRSRKNPPCEKLHLRELYLGNREQLLKEREKFVMRIMEDFLQELLELKLSLNSNDNRVIDEKYDAVQGLLNIINGEKTTKQKTRIEYVKDLTKVTTKLTTTVVNKQNKSRKTFFSCDEIFKGTTYGYPFYETGFVQVNCNKPTITDTVSLVLDRPRISNGRKYIFPEIMRSACIFKNAFVVAEEKDKEIINAFDLPKNIKVEYFGEKSSQLGSVLNRILLQLKTPLVVIASHLGRFENTSDIERLINVYEISGAGIVGTAVKNIDNGEWDRGCYKMQLKLYTLKYVSEYDTSIHECLHCNFVKGAFLTATKLLLSHKFHENLTYGIFEDFFLRLNKAQVRILVCPDVMFYSYKSVEYDFQLKTFARIWDIKKIVITDGRVYWYGCRRGYAHTTKTKCEVRKGMSVPPCCLANLMDAVTFIFQQCNEHNIKCELEEGSVLGAVKFHGLLPWERDADITTLSSDFHKFENLTKTFERHGYYLAIYERPKCCAENGKLKGGVLHIRANGWSIQIYGQHELTTHQSAQRTRMRLSSQWVYLPENPGLYARNRYGIELYKHAEHWLTTGHKSGWETYVSGKFETCSRPGHHACLDNFEADGDARFKQ